MNPVKSTYSTDPKEITAAQNQAEHLRSQRKMLDEDLIKRMKNGSLIDANQIDWDSLGATSSKN